MADNCHNESRAQAIRDLAKKVKATADKFEATHRGAAQEQLAETLRQDLAALEQNMRTAVAAAMTDAAMGSTIVPQVVDHASQTNIPEEQWTSVKQKLRRHTIVLTTAARNAGAMSDDPRRVQLVKATSEQLERCSDQVSWEQGREEWKAAGSFFASQHAFDNCSLPSHSCWPPLMWSSRSQRMTLPRRT